MRLRDVVKAERTLIGERADFKTQVENRELEFTAWQFFDNKFGKGVILQFYDNNRPYIFITHSGCLMEDLMEWERRMGTEGFTASIGWTKTKGGRNALVFI